MLCRKRLSLFYFKTAGNLKELRVMQIAHHKNHIFKLSDIIIYLTFFLFAILLYFWQYWFDYLNFQGVLILGVTIIAITLIAGKNVILRSYTIYNAHRKHQQFVQLKHLDEAEKYILANWVFSGYSEFAWDLINQPFRQKQKLVNMLHKFEGLGYITHVHFYHMRETSSLVSCGFSLHDNNNLKLRKSLNHYRRLQ